MGYNLFVLSRELNREDSKKEYWSREGEKAPTVFTTIYGAFEAGKDSGFFTDDNVSTVIVERIGVIG